jgi:NAD(P)-dependent dehydrogenase (short-subunit alcohol dehydrogenase family)
VSTATLAGRVCLITGATSGIGCATAHALAAQGAEVVLLARHRARAEAVRDAIAAATGGAPPALVVCDLASQADIARAAEAYLATGRPLHVLVNNAGVVNRARRETVDGIEETLAVNHLAVFALTLRLLPRLRTSGSARIVTVASNAHRFAALDLDDLQQCRRYAAMRAYARSKLANLYFTFELARRVAEREVTVNAVDPGAVATGLGMHDGGLLARIAGRVTRLLFQAPSDGAATSVYAASAAELAGRTGLYLARCAPTRPHPRAEDRAIATRLWAASEALTGVRFPAGSA